MVFFTESSVMKLKLMIIRMFLFEPFRLRKWYWIENHYFACSYKLYEQFKRLLISSVQLHIWMAPIVHLLICQHIYDVFGCFFEFHTELHYNPTQYRTVQYSTVQHRTQWTLVQWLMFWCARAHFTGTFFATLFGCKMFIYLFAFVFIYWQLHIVSAFILVA